MAGWAQQETALWIRGVVQRVQGYLLQQLPAAADAGVVRDGKYSLALHEGFEKYGSLNGYPDHDWYDDGPPNAAFLPGMTDGDALLLRAAWAWWSIRRLSPVPAEATKVAEEYNALLYGNGDQPLRPKDTEEFVGDRRPLQYAGKGIAIGFACVIMLGLGLALGHRFGQRMKCGSGLLREPRR